MYSRDQGSTLLDGITQEMRRLLRSTVQGRYVFCVAIGLTWTPILDFMSIPQKIPLSSSIAWTEFTLESAGVAGRLLLRWGVRTLPPTAVAGPESDQTRPELKEGFGIFARKMMSQGTRFMQNCIPARPDPAQQGFWCRAGMHFCIRVCKGLCGCVWEIFGEEFLVEDVKQNSGIRERHSYDVKNTVQKSYLQATNTSDNLKETQRFRLDAHL